MRHNSTVKETEMTSRIDGEPDLHEEADRDSPMRRWRIITAFLALLAMAVILLWAVSYTHLTLPTN